VAIYSPFSDCCPLNICVSERGVKCALDLLDEDRALARRASWSSTSGGSAAKTRRPIRRLVGGWPLCLSPHNTLSLRISLAFLLTFKKGSDNLNANVGSLYVSNMGHWYSV
jgi:hypothetical protein